MTNETLNCSDTPQDCPHCGAEVPPLSDHKCEGESKLAAAEAEVARLKADLKVANETLDRVNVAAQRTESTLVDLDRNLRHILKSCAVEVRPCLDCQRMLYFIRIKSGAKQPFEKTGLPHFARCPAADKFRRPR